MTLHGTLILQGLLIRLLYRSDFTAWVQDTAVFDNQVVFLPILASMPYLFYRCAACSSVAC